MNIGIYVNSLSDTNLEYVSNFINESIVSNYASDASIFFDDVGYNPHQVQCGIFNSADIWNFHGVLITTSLDTLSSAKNIVNNIDLYYYYGYEDSSKINLLNLIDKTKNVKVICNTESDSLEFYRKTGKKPSVISERYKGLASQLQGHQNEYSKNTTNVYRAK